MHCFIHFTLRWLNRFWKLYSLTCTCPTAIIYSLTMPVAGILFWSFQYISYCHLLISLYFQFAGASPTKSPPGNICLSCFLKSTTTSILTKLATCPVIWIVTLCQLKLAWLKNDFWYRGGKLMQATLVGFIDRNNSCWSVIGWLWLLAIIYGKNILYCRTKSLYLHLVIYMSIGLGHVLWPMKHFWETKHCMWEELRHIQTLESIHGERYTNVHQTGLNFPFPSGM